MTIGPSETVGIDGFGFAEEAFSPTGAYGRQSGFAVRSCIRPFLRQSEVKLERLRRVADVKLADEPLYGFGNVALKVRVPVECPAHTRNLHWNIDTIRLHGEELIPIVIHYGKSLKDSEGNWASADRSALARGNVLLRHGDAKGKRRRFAVDMTHTETGHPKERLLKELKMKKMRSEFERRYEPFPLAVS